MLGELNADQLWETTLNPENRILVQVSLDDLEKAQSVTELLMSKKFTEQRREWLKDHKAFDIDI